MRIALDGAALTRPGTGPHRHLTGLLSALPPLLAAGDTLVLYRDSAATAPPLAAQVEERLLAPALGPDWYRTSLPDAIAHDGCDVVLGAAGLLPALPGVPAVLVMHDCGAFRRSSTGASAAEGFDRDWTLRSAHAAHAVVAVSAWTASQCAAWLQLDPAAIRVVPPGVDPCFTPPAPGEDATELPRALVARGVPPRFVLHVGGGRRHKGAAMAVEAVRLLRRRGLDVALVGCGPVGPRGFRPGMVDLGLVDDAALVSLYRAAAAVCLTGEHEGFGLPAVEAMACGTPVVAVDAGGLAEAGGDAAVVVGRSAEQVASGLSTLLGDAAERERRRELGLRQASRLTWTAAASALLDTLLDTAGGRLLTGRAHGRSSAGEARPGPGHAPSPQA